jgi:hypothetical protein
MCPPRENFEVVKPRPRAFFGMPCGVAALTASNFAASIPSAHWWLISAVPIVASPSKWIARCTPHSERTTTSEKRSWSRRATGWCASPTRQSNPIYRPYWTRFAWSRTANRLAPRSQSRALAAGVEASAPLPAHWERGWGEGFNPMYACASPRAGSLSIWRPFCFT